MRVCPSFPFYLRITAGLLLPMTTRLSSIPLVDLKFINPCCRPTRHLSLGPQSALIVQKLQELQSLLISLCYLSLVCPKRNNRKWRIWVSIFFRHKWSCSRILSILVCTFVFMYTFQTAKFVFFYFLDVVVYVWYKFLFVFIHSLLRSSIPMFICLRGIVCSFVHILFERYQKGTKSKRKRKELPFS